MRCEMPQQLSAISVSDEFVSGGSSTDALE